MFTAGRKANASRALKTETSTTGIAAPPVQERRNSHRSSRNSNVSETTNSRGMNQAQITAEQLGLEQEENIDINANINTDHDSESEGRQLSEESDQDDPPEEETLEKLVAKANASRINSGREIQLQKGLAILYAQGDNLTHDCEEI
jgi:hypothetical protein